MAANIDPPYVITPTIGIATLTSAAPITSRANITGTTGLVQLTPVSAFGKPVQRIRVKCKGTSVASNLFIWLNDGTTSYLIDEIDIAAITASTIVDSFSTYKDYPDLVLPAAYKLYVSQTVSTDLTVFAMGGDY